MSFQLSKFQLTEQQTHAIIIVVLLIVAIILLVLVVKAVKKESFRHRAVGATGGLAARLRAVGAVSGGLGAKSKSRIQIKEGFDIIGPSTGGTFNLNYSENFVAGQTGQGAAGLKAEGFAPLVDSSGLKSHLRTKQRIIY